MEKLIKRLEGEVVALKTYADLLRTNGQNNEANSESLKADGLLEAIKIIKREFK